LAGSLEGGAFGFVVESLAAAGVIAIVGTLWRLSNEHSGMRVALEHGMGQVVEQIKGLRNEIRRDVERLEDVLEDHEHRLRKLEQEP
jgi:hypothetical protein